MASATAFHTFKPLNNRGQEVTFDQYRGKAVLVVNTASKCGFTPQYANLESLYKRVTEKHGDRFTILGFPCNQFRDQEPGTSEEIQNFCQINYGVSFPIMKKVDVNGDGAAPLYSWLREQRPALMGLEPENGESPHRLYQWLEAENPGLMGSDLVKWNFEKFLIGTDGRVKGRWASTVPPETLEAQIIAELEAKA